MEQMTMTVSTLDRSLNVQEGLVAKLFQSLAQATGQGVTPQDTQLRNSALQAEGIGQKVNLTV